MHFYFLASSVENFDVEAQRLHFLHEYLEGLGNARLRNVVTLDDRFVDLDATKHVVGLNGEKFLQAVRSAVGLECPHFHFAEALATELSLTTKRLLSDHAVWASGACVNLVVDKVVQLQDVHVTNSDVTVVDLAGAAVTQ
ncbi:unannotated protein [freshwater metagenome]|uniref:Unannotated protein n=1 Tax=freshwater metagenome TaxID=449393 RepID=A0A6J7NUH7_9ZZZZ